MDTVQKPMSPILRDVLISAAGFLILLILLAVLPLVMADGIAYLFTLIGFIIVVCAAGLTVGQ